MTAKSVLMRPQSLLKPSSCYANAARAHENKLLDTTDRRKSSVKAICYCYD